MCSTCGPNKVTHWEGNSFPMARSKLVPIETSQVSLAEGTHTEGRIEPVYCRCCAFLRHLYREWMGAVVLSVLNGRCGVVRIEWKVWCCPY